MPEQRAPETVARKPRSNLATRVLAAIVLIPLALGTAIFGSWPFAAFWTAAALAIVYEWVVLVSKPQQRFTLLSASGVVYAGALLFAVIALRSDVTLGLAAIVFLFAVVWATDIGGYFVGRAFGGPKLMPSVSPNKTWSGAIGGTIAAILCGGAVYYFMVGSRIGVAAVLALLLSIAAQAGDLFESFLKRRFDAKDASKLIPGHGGVMDRLDGFITAAVVAVLIGVCRGGLDAPARGFMIW